MQFRTSLSLGAIFGCLGLAALGCGTEEDFPAASIERKQGAATFVPITLLNGWTNSPQGAGPATIVDLGGMVQFKGAISTTGTNPFAFTLPVGWRPPVRVYVPVNLCGFMKGRLVIQPNGATEVEAENSRWSDAQCITSLDGASFAPNNSGYTTLALQNGWTHAPFSTRNAAVKVINGIVRFEGAIASGTTTSPFTLPAGFRPSNDVYVPIDVCNAHPGRLKITPSGGVNIQWESDGTFAMVQCFVSLEGVHFALNTAGFTSMTLLNGWVNAPFSTRNARAKVDSGVVRFQGGISSGDTLAPLFVLPAGFRPNATVRVLTNLCDAARGRIRIMPNGETFVDDPSVFDVADCFTSLEGVSFAL